MSQFDLLPNYINFVLALQFWLCFLILFCSMQTSVEMSEIFPPKDLEKIRALKIRMRRFFLIIPTSTRIFFPSMPVSLSGIINHSHSFTRLEIYHHIYFIVILCLKMFYFPAKKLRKNTGAQNTLAPFFFKKKFKGIINIYFTCQPFISIN